MPEVSEREAQIRDAYRFIASTTGYRAGPVIDLARQWCTDEDCNGMCFEIGCTNFATAKQTVYVVEAARCLCGASDDVALRLLRKAVEDLEEMHPVLSR